MQIYTNFESNSQLSDVVKIHIGIVSDANLHKFWKQFTTYFLCVWKFLVLFPMQIYTNFESNSQPYDGSTPQGNIVSDANLHKFWKQFTTWGFSILYWTQLFPMQIYTNFESNSQRVCLSERRSNKHAEAAWHFEHIFHDAHSHKPRLSPSAAAYIDRIACAAQLVKKLSPMKINSFHPLLFGSAKIKKSRRIGVTRQLQNSKLKLWNLKYVML